MDLADKVIPTQMEGSQTGSTAVKKTGSRREASLLFVSAKQRLLEVNKWKALSRNKGAEFQLTDSYGNLNDEIPEQGDLIRIKLPAPTNPSGDGYDWVRIEKFVSERNLQTDEEVFGMITRPVKNPHSNVNNSAHFYTNDATSSFVVYRKGQIVYAIERGRNEIANPTGSVFNQVRNFLVAIPAKLGFSKPQGQRLMTGILTATTLKVYRYG